MRNLLFFLIFLLPYICMGGDSYKKVLDSKKGTLDIYFYNSDHFISSSGGIISGIEYDLFIAFKEYLHDKGVEIKLNFIKASDFPTLYQTIQNGASGDFGACSFSITEKRLKEVNFSPIYMPDIEVLICSQNIPVIADTVEFIKAFAHFKALSVPNTTFEKDLLILKKLIPGLQIENVEDAREIRKRIANEPNLFSYIELPNYLIAISEGIRLKRQPLFNQERSGYGIIFPKSSDWSKPINEFFNSADFKRKMNVILKKHLGQDIQDLIWEIRDSEGKQEITLLTKEREIQNEQLDRNEMTIAEGKMQRRVLLFSIGIAIIIILLSIASIRIKLKANKQLALRNEEIENQKIIIEEKNKNITDSILYAQNIQNALLPDINFLKSRFKDYFVLFKPRDIVSGDFYFFSEVEEITILVLADCTGHGVPGAMVSMMGVNYLSQIINDNAITTPAQALEELNLKVTKALGNTKVQSRDGMDIVMLIFDKSQQKLTFSGGKNSIYLLRDGEFKQYKGNSFSIGSDGTSDKKFTNHIIDLHKGDQIYTFTDGYADQFGGPKGKKLKVRALLNSIKEQSKNKMEVQNLVLKDKLDSWMDGFEQVDDISIFGLKI